MDHNELPFELERQRTCANLSGQDLRDMGKQASNMFLGGQCSLNDAIVKLAHEHSGISTHQVRRVLEFANTNTFQSLFEKQAGDKNVQFPIAEPDVVLKKLSAEVEAPIMRPVGEDYAKDPVKIGMGIKNVSADIELCKVFGVEVKTAALEKAAFFPEMLKNMALGAGVGAATAALGSGIGSMTDEDDKQRVYQEAIGGAFGGAMNAFGPNAGNFGMSAGPAIADILPPSIGGGGDSNEESDSDPFSTRLGSSPLDKLLSKFGEAGCAALAPVERKVRKDSEKTAATANVLIKQATAYAKSGRDRGSLIQADMEKAASLENIMEATAKHASYTQHNPFGDLFRMKQNLEKLAEESYMAKARNSELTKEAVEQLHRVASNELLAGTSFGEMVHAMNHVADGQWVKEAVAQLAPKLAARGFNLVKLSASMIPYEMQKTASRAPNPENPVLKAFSSYVKLASNQPQLNAVHEKVAQALEQVEDRVRKVLETSNAARSK
jgi:hypothetical protein